MIQTRIVMTLLVGVGIIASGGDLLAETSPSGAPKFNFTEACQLDKGFRFEEDLKIGDRSRLVSNLNCVLEGLVAPKNKKSKYSEVFSQKTSMYLKRIQREFGLPVTGKLDADTRKSVNQYLELILGMEFLSANLKQENKAKVRARDGLPNCSKENVVYIFPPVAVHLGEHSTMTLKTGGCKLDTGKSLFVITNNINQTKAPKIGGSIGFYFVDSLWYRRHSNSVSVQKGYDRLNLIEQSDENTYKLSLDQKTKDWFCHSTEVTDSSTFRVSVEIASVSKSRTRPSRPNTPLYHSAPFQVAGLEYCNRDSQVVVK